MQNSVSAVPDLKHLNLIKGALFGMAVGDALGVPVEFIERKALREQPVTGMREHGTHNQPAGTWSDDSSLAFCLAEMLCNGYNLDDLGKRFTDWQACGYWTPHGVVFDAGITCASAIHRISKGTPPVLAGGALEGDNGNGSLMRIIPLLFHTIHLPADQRFHIIREVSSLTHRHIRSVLACFIYLEFAAALVRTKNKTAAYREMQSTVTQFLDAHDICSQDEKDRFHRILDIRVGLYEKESLLTADEHAIYSNAYVVNTLEASLWCLMQTETFSDAVLKAVNLGNDSDTTGAVTGGLAGILYGFDSIPTAWIQVLARKADINDLCLRLSAATI